MRILKKQSFNMDLEKESLTLGGVKRRCGEFDNFLLVVNLITPCFATFLISGHLQFHFILNE